MKWVLKHEDLQMFDRKLNQIWVIFTCFKLRIAGAMHNVKQLNFKQDI